MNLSKFKPLSLVIIGQLFATALAEQPSLVPNPQADAAVAPISTSALRTESVREIAVDLLSRLEAAGSELSMGDKDLLDRLAASMGKSREEYPYGFPVETNNPKKMIQLGWERKPIAEIVLDPGDAPVSTSTVFSGSQKSVRQLEKQSFEGRVCRRGPYFILG